VWVSWFPTNLRQCTSANVFQISESLPNSIFGKKLGMPSPYKGSVLAARSWILRPPWSLRRQTTLQVAIYFSHYRHLAKRILIGNNPIVATLPWLTGWNISFVVPYHSVFMRTNLPVKGYLVLCSTKTSTIFFLNLNIRWSCTYYKFQYNFSNKTSTKIYRYKISIKTKIHMHDSRSDIHASNKQNYQTPHYT
jgi:hypothetical protein